MTGRAVIATSELSRGAQATRDALERAGLTTTWMPLEQVTGNDPETVYVDRSLPPYSLPARNWNQHWWNRPGRSWRAWSKTLTALTAAEQRIPHPATIAFETLHGSEHDPASMYVSETERAQLMLDVLATPIVVKPDRGMQGHGVTLVRNLDELIAATRAVGCGVAQAFLPEAATTLRVVCTRNQGVATIARTAAVGDWRANVAQGAHAQDVDLPQDDPAVALAVTVTRAFGLDFAGIDIVETDNGPVLLEANPAFGIAEGQLQPVFTRALDQLVADLLHHRRACSCGATGPHDAWACND